MAQHNSDQAERTPDYLPNAGRQATAFPKARVISPVVSPLLEMHHGESENQTGYVLGPPPTATTDDDHTPCASGGKTPPTLLLRMPQSGTERPSPHLRLVGSKDRRSGSRTRHRDSQDHPPPAQLTAALHGAGGKTAPTLLLRMTQSGTERPSPHLRLVGSKDRRSGSRTRHRGSHDHHAPTQLAAALHGAG